MTKKQNKPPYTHRKDKEKIESNWRKTSGLLKRKEWSMAIVRVVTTVELTANYVVRVELSQNRGLEPYFVNSLLKWANGISGKFDRLLIPIFRGHPFQSDLKDLKKQIKDINKERNNIAHSGQFKKESTANRVIFECQEIIETLLNHYDENFKLEDLNEKNEN